jgi:hypothetical protein
MRKYMALLVLTLFISFSVMGFQTELTSEKEVANTPSPAIYELNIQNDNAVNSTYSISLLSPKSSWIYYPNTVHVPAGKNRSVEISVSPTERALQETYGFETKVREKSSGEIQSLRGAFRVEQPYSVDIIGLSRNKQEFNPGEVVETDLRIKNLESQAVKDYKVVSRFEGEQRTETGTSILPGGERLYEFDYRIGEDREPGEISIDYQVLINGETEREESQNISVSQIKNVSRSSSKENKVISVTRTKNVENNGNTPVNTSVTAEVPSYLASITSGDPQPDNIQKIDGNNVLTWNVELDQGEEFSVEYTTEYWIPVTALMLLSLGLVAIKKIGNQVSVRKTAESKPGEIKINLEISNKSGKTFEELELEEFIPDIATVDEKFSMNTPKVRKTSEGTKLFWKIQDLQPGDQRVIQYKINPKVDVEEDISLESALIKDENGQKLVQSNGLSTEFTPDTT